MQPEDGDHGAAESNHEQDGDERPVDVQDARARRAGGAQIRLPAQWRLVEARSDAHLEIDQVAARPHLTLDLAKPYDDDEHGHDWQESGQQHRLKQASGLRTGADSEHDSCDRDSRAGNALLPIYRSERLGAQRLVLLKCDCQPLVVDTESVARG